MLFKLKTRKSVLKRIQFKKNFLKRKKANKRHLLRKKSTKQLRTLSLKSKIHSSNKIKFYKMLPYIN